MIKSKRLRKFFKKAVYYEFALTDKKVKKARYNGIIQERLTEFRRLTGTIKVDTIPSYKERKNARLRRYTG